MNAPDNTHAPSTRATPGDHQQTMGNTLAAMTLVCAMMTATPMVGQNASVAAPETPWPATAAAAPRPFDRNATAGSIDNQSDPGYPLYKEGYGLVLEERWAEARKKFAALVERYPKSDYADDAYYWSAYSLKYTDRKKAIEAYKKFIQTYRQSSYYDDAVADLNSLQPGAASATGSFVVDVPEVPEPPVKVFVAPYMKTMERQLKRELRHLGRVGLEHMAPRAIYGMPVQEKLDPATRLKMDALYALGETKEDDKAYATLKDVALDLQQPRPLREAAMDALSHFTKYDVLSVFIEIAKKDTSRDIQGFAIDFIGEHGTDKNQRVVVLEDLYRALPRDRTSQRQNIVYTIADVGNDRAVNFLKMVALSDESYDLRRDAVYYLGNIGGDRARAALYEILQVK